ncbi:MAG: ergothioneine biosynthesis protein EgtB [Pontixanthobacter sp.]
MPSSVTSDNRAHIGERFRATRALTAALIEPLSDADATIQSMEDASPAKWHLGHTNWFFETFLLRDHRADYTLYDPRWPFVFNSYYEAEGERIDRFARGMLSRPTVAQIADWRGAVDDAMSPMLDDPALADLIELGIAHEQQHQELLLTDIKHALFQNPIGPAMVEPARRPEASPRTPQEWRTYPGGIARIGHDGSGFAYDNEGPAHRVLLEPFGLSNRLVTNAEWQAFIDDGGYRTAAHWLSDGWSWVQREAIAAPLYWHEGEQFSHYGWMARDPHGPVTHISYYEADAFATWAGARLPTEEEWEVAAQDADPAGGNQLDGLDDLLPSGGADLFGDCWQFTRSAYLPYPRFQPAEGAIGEYNGKFMSGQFILRGASCATARGHSRSTYRNFFYPHQRWQFTGLRLAKDVR